MFKGVSLGCKEALLCSGAAHHNSIQSFSVLGSDSMPHAFARHILMATPQDIALAKNRLDQGEAGLQLRGV